MSPPLLHVPELVERVRVPEIMDSPGLDRERHIESLATLATVNRLSRTAVRVWSEVRAASAAGVAPVRVLDVACGGGDVLLDVSRRARRSGIAVRLLGCDASRVALDYAAELGRGDPALGFERVDVVSDPLPGVHHVVVSSLFLHHLSTGAAIELLRGMARAAERVLLVQDLRRTRRGYVLASATLRALSRSDVARSDGPTSVRAAFTTAEAKDLATAAGLEGATVRSCWPQRWVLRWERAAA